MIRSYYFGCWGDTGHFLFDVGGHHVRTRVAHSSPLPKLLTPEGGLDGGYAPVGISESSGIAAMHHVHGWTVLAFWDRSVDSRPGSNSAFLAKANPGFAYTFNEMIEIAQRAFPVVWERIDNAYALVEHQP